MEAAFKGGPMYFRNVMPNPLQAAAIAIFLEKEDYSGLDPI
jgi:hypothetical protein